MVTDKQWKVIRFIEANLGIEFKGKWKEEASVFIEMNIEESKLAARERKLLTRELYDPREYQEVDEFTAEDYYNYLDWYDFV